MLFEIFSSLQVLYLKKISMFIDFSLVQCLAKKDFFRVLVHYEM